MRKSEEALTCLAVDEIPWNDGSEGDVILNRVQFETRCKWMRGKQTGISVPVIARVVEEFEAAWRARIGLDEERGRWLDRFFTVTNMVRFRNIYEVRDRLKLKIKQLYESGIPSIR